MRSNIMTCCFVLLVAFSVHGQQGISFKPMESSVEVFSADGRPFTNPAIDVEGNPFFHEAWEEANLLLVGGRQIGPIKVRLNLETQEVHFIDRQGREMAIPAGMIRDLKFAGAGGKDSVGAAFRSGYPPVDRQDGGTFYQVLCQGRIELLVCLRKAIAVQKDGISGEVKKAYNSYEDYYIFNGSEIKRLKRDKSFIGKEFGARFPQVEVFAGKSGLKFRSIEDIRRLFDYCNGLP